MRTPDKDLIELYNRVDNTGRWGNDDELGTLNYITPAKRAAAAALVREGLVITLAHPISPENATEGRLALAMRYGRPPAAAGVPMSSNDRFTVEPHQSGLTHVDCLAHIASHEGLVYNGRKFDDAAQAGGLVHGSVFAQRGGIVSRGVLLDLALAAGKDAIDPSVAISAADLEAAEKRENVRIESGDVLLLRGGTRYGSTSLRWKGVCPGPSADAIEWMHNREIAAYGGDMPDHVSARGAKVLGYADAEDPNETLNHFPFPLHQVGIPAMGLVLFDHCNVEELAAACIELNRWEFLFMAAPLPIVGASGSAINPLALF